MTRFTPLKNFCDIADKYLAPIEFLISLEQINNCVVQKLMEK